MKLKKRLPALFLALFLAFTPLILAVPVRADVFSGVWSFSTDQFSVCGDPSVLRSNTILVFTSGFGIYPHLIVSDSPIDFQISDDMSSITFSDVYRCVRISEDATSYFYPASSPDYFGTLTLSSVVGFMAFGDVVGYSPDETTVYPGELVLSFSPGVSSVFSGVGSWLGGAVNNLISMFYTAETGLTVLGVLAVASLAFAVLLLLFYLLAGWLKFR